MNKVLGFLLLTFLSINLVSGKDIFPLTNPVMDQVGALNPSTMTNLQEILQDYYIKTDTQIQVVIVDSLENEEISTYAIKLFDSWKLGKEKTDKGVLF